MMLLLLLVADALDDVVVVVAADTVVVVELVDLSIDDSPDSLQLALLDPDDGVDGAPLQVENWPQQVHFSAQQTLFDVQNRLDDGHLEVKDGTKDGLLDVEEGGEDPCLGGYLLFKQPSYIGEHFLLVLLLLTPTSHLLLFSVPHSCC